MTFLMIWQKKEKVESCNSVQFHPVQFTYLNKSFLLQIVIIHFLFFLLDVSISAKKGIISTIAHYTFLK